MASYRNGMVARVLMDIILVILAFMGVMFLALLVLFIAALWIPDKFTDDLF